VNKADEEADAERGRQPIKQVMFHKLYHCEWRVESGNVNHHAMKRLRQWLCRKHKVRG
jgi:hypothetical protein